MDAGDTDRKPDVVLRGRRMLSRSFGTFVEISRNPDRPAVFDVLFWLILALTYAFRIFEPEVRVEGLGLAPMTVVCAVLVVVWMVLPWRPSVSRRRKLLAPVFLVVSTFMLSASDLVWALGLYPIAFANAVFLFGLSRGGAYSAAILLFFFGTTFARSLSGDTAQSPETVVQVFALIALLTVVCMGLSSAILEARRSREQAEELLDDLEAAHDELRRYAGRVRELTLSEERARMAREIHDSVGHHLTAVRLQTEAALKTTERRPEQAKVQIERARDLASDAYEEIRRSVRALGPRSDGERYGSGALRSLLRSFEGTGFDISFDVEGKERDLSEESELVLHRALQESLTNAVRHSGARRVGVAVAFEDDRVKLSVTDDGRGVRGGITDGGFGLRSLRERVEMLGGRFNAGNVSGGGFEVEVELPEAGSP